MTDGGQPGYERYVPPAYKYPCSDGKMYQKGSGVLSYRYREKDVSRLSGYIAAVVARSGVPWD